jgi:uncharacterized protein (DUF1501 family)
MPMNRRQFVQASCTAAAALAMPRWAAAGTFEKTAGDDRILVVINLEGGNDGLNTVVPVSDARYAKLRGRLGLSRAQTIPIDAKTGFHPNLKSLAKLMNRGQLAVIEGVGYPQADLSHFRSNDIWSSGVAETYETTGWLGRALDDLYGQQLAALHSLAFGYAIPPAFYSRAVTTPVIYDPWAFQLNTDPYFPEDDGAKRQAVAAMFAPLGARTHDFIGDVGRMALADSAAVRGAIENHANAPQYPDSDVAHLLQYTAAVISAGLGPRVYWVAQGGYDTHDSQRGEHDGLLLDLDQALSAFLDDLQRHNADRRVAVLVWSEFGRRVEDNGSGGTDHGTAAPVFVLGTQVHGGFYGRRPSLSDLDDDGNLRYTVDFRSVYTTLLRDWIGVDPARVITGSFEPLPFFG